MDIRQNFTTGLTYQIPFGRGKQFGSNMNRAVDAAVGGWQFNGILTLHTGEPYTVSAPSSACQGVWAGCFPDLLPGANPNAAPPGGRTPSQWFNTANFTAPASPTEGNLGDNTNALGRGSRTSTSRYLRTLLLPSASNCSSERRVFNLTNTPQFNFPDSGYGDSNFGKVTSTLAGTERHIQFALKLAF